jgi:hypothetical protein
MIFPEFFKPLMLNPFRSKRSGLIDLEARPARAR